MAFYSGEKLKTLLKTVLGNQFDEKRIEQAGYELSLGDEYYRTDSDTGTKEVLDDKKMQIAIEPGQFALLLTKEEIFVPNNVMAFISIKFKQKKRGLVNVSGFHVDPGFKGRIKFSVYNAGPATIILDRGAPFFVIWFSELNDSVAKPYDGSHLGQTSIDGDDIGQLQGELASPNALLEKIKKSEIDWNEKIKDLERNWNEKIKDLERKKLENKFLITLLITIIIGASTAIGVRVYWDTKSENAADKINAIQNVAIDSIQNAQNESIQKIEHKLNQSMDSIKSLLDNRIDSKKETKKNGKGS